MILSLGNNFYRLKLQFRKDRKGIEAFDFFEGSELENSHDFFENFDNIEIPKTGYFFKPDQLYVFRGDGIYNSANNLNKRLKALGIKYTELTNTDYILDFKFPVKLYRDTSVFIV